MYRRAGAEVFEERMIACFEPRQGDIFRPNAVKEILEAEFLEEAGIDSGGEVAPPVVSSPPRRAYQPPIDDAEYELRDNRPIVLEKVLGDGWCTVTFYGAVPKPVKAEEDRGDRRQEKGGKGVYVGKYKIAPPPKRTTTTRGTFFKKDE